MSILRTNQIQDTGTNVAANISGGTVTFTNPPVGAFINQVDQFRLTADLINPGDAAITSNFERVDNATFSKIGTGMTESSGIFTFPSTGLYRIGVMAHMYIPSGNDGAVGINTQVSSNSGSSYEIAAIAWAGSTAGGQWYGTHFSEYFINVTNISTIKVRFTANSMSNCIIVGQSSRNQTAFSFIRLGESQWVN